ARGGDSVRLKALERRRQLGGGGDQRAGRRRRQWRERLRSSGKGIEQDRCCRGASGKTADRRAVPPPYPYANGALAVEPYRRGVAIAVARSGLERDAPARGALRRRRALQDLGDVPGGHRLQQPLLRLPWRVDQLPQRQHVAAAGKAGIEHREVGKLDADATKAKRKPRRRASRRD